MQHNQAYRGHKEEDDVFVHDSFDWFGFIPLSLSLGHCWGIRVA